MVTGGNRGIGKEVCRQLAERGLTVLLSGRDLGKAEVAAAELAMETVLPAQLDVTDADSVSRGCAMRSRRVMGGWMCW